MRPRASWHGSADLHVVIADANQKAVDAVIGVSDLEVGEHHYPLGVDGAVGDPILLRQRGGRVHYKLVCRHQLGLRPRPVWLTLCVLVSITITNTDHTQERNPPGGVEHVHMVGHNEI